MYSVSSPAYTRRVSMSARVWVCVSRLIGGSRQPVRSALRSAVRSAVRLGADCGQREISLRRRWAAWPECLEVMAPAWRFEVHGIFARVMACRRCMTANAWWKLHVCCHASWVAFRHFVTGNLRKECTSLL